MPSPKLRTDLRKYHRWLGFFLAGIISIYAVSGILLIFRKTDFLKVEYANEQVLPPNLSANELGSAIKIKDLEIISNTPQELTFKQGSYNKETGVATIMSKGYPYVLAKLVNLHKATHKSPLFFMNITFGLCLLFFVISAFIMFMPKTAVFQNGMKIAAGGFVFALLMVLFGS